MKIGFWSPKSGQFGNTSNLLLVALYNSLTKKQNGIILSTQFDDHSLERAVFPRQDNLLMMGSSAMDASLDSILKVIKTSVIGKDGFDMRSTNVYTNNRISVVPGSSLRHEELFYKELYSNHQRLLKLMGMSYEYVYVDIESGFREPAKLLMNCCDLVVVSLSQNVRELHNFFNSKESPYHKMDKSKLFFVLGNYDLKSKFNLTNLRRSYPQLSKTNTGLVEYNPMFNDACSEGSVADFVYRNYRNKKEDQNYSLVAGISDICTKLDKFQIEEEVGAVS